MIYRTKWAKNAFVSFIQYCRDFTLYYLPLPRLPGIALKMLYGVNPQFIFLVHPRRSEDIFIALPFLSIVRRLFSKKIFLEIIKKLPPFVIATIKTPIGIEGVVVSSLYLPEFLIKKRRITLKESLRAINIARKISMKNSIMGLGAWWPVVTRGGLAMRNMASKSDIRVTNGHTGTLVSLYLMIKKIAKLGGLDLKRIKVAIIGAGKMGTNLGRVLAKEIDFICIIDVNNMRLKKLSEELKKVNNELKVEAILKNENICLSKILDKYHLCVCVTSNARRIIKPEDIPANFIVIDDSRPEAISRNDMEHDKIILEGGLLKIKGVDMFYDYGFGMDENIFGCLGETYLLARDAGRKIEPTIGDVDINNFSNMLKACQDYDIEVGDFKSQDVKVLSEDIARIICRREESIGLHKYQKKK